MGYISCCGLVFCILCCKNWPFKTFYNHIGHKKTANTIAVTSIKGIIIKHVWEVKYIYVQYMYSQFTYVLNCQWKWVGFLLCNYIIFFFFIKSCIWISYEKKQQSKICKQFQIDPKEVVPWSHTGVLICYYKLHFPFHFVCLKQ